MAEERANTQVKRTLVAVSDFATVDEIAAAVVLTRATQKLAGDSERVSLYLGKFNFPARLQKVIDVSDLKLYQPRQAKNEFVVSLKLQEPVDVNNIRWEQAGTELNIHVELSRAVSKDIPATFANSARAIASKLLPQFDRLLLMGCKDISEVEESSFLASHNDFSKAVITKYVSQNGSSLAEVVAAEVSKLGYELSIVDRNLLWLGTANDRARKNVFLSRIGRPLFNEVGEFEPLALSNSDYANLINFWSGRGKVEADDIADLAALINLHPQFSPFSYVGNNESLTRSFTNGTDELVLSNDPQKLSARNHDGKSKRSFSNYVIAREKLLEISPVDTPSVGVSPKAAKVERVENVKISEDESVPTEKPAPDVAAPTSPPGEYIPLQPAR